MRQGAAQVVVMPPPRQRVNYQVWAIAASVVLVTGAVAYWGVYEFPALQGGPRATVEQVDGSPLPRERRARLCSSRLARNSMKTISSAPR